MYDFFLLLVSFVNEFEFDDVDFVRSLSFELEENTLFFLCSPLKFDLLVLYVLLLFSLYKSKFSFKFSLIFFLKASRLTSLNDETNLFGCGEKNNWVGICPYSFICISTAAFSIGSLIESMSTP